MKLPLTTGAYSAKSIIADAQRCVNLYVEENPPDAPFPNTHYLTPGLNIVVPASATKSGVVRQTYRASNGDLYAAIGDTVYYISPSFVATSLGTIDSGTNSVYMADNGLVILLCNGTPNLYAIDLTTRSFGQVTSPNIYGADRVDYLDTFFILNVPGTNKWYISLSEVNFAMLTSIPGSILTGSIIDSGDTGAILTGAITVQGTGYTDGTYTNIPFTGGTGTGATVNLIISGGFVITAGINQPGINYLTGDILGINTASLSVAATGTYTFTGNPNNGDNIVLNGVTWTFVTSGATGPQTNIGVNLAATLNNLSTDLNASANASLNVASYTNSSTVLTITYKTAGTGGNAYTLAVGTYGGSVSAATLTGGVTAAGAGFAYTVQTTTGSYTNGTYPGVALTGGSGTGAQATIIITGGQVTTVTITAPGINYTVGDVLSANPATIGGTGSGFGYSIDALGGFAFDPLDIASKAGYPDPISGLIVMNLQIWLIGQLTTEIWNNTGAADFTFQIQPGVFIEHGCIATYSIAKQDLSVYWLSQDEQGHAIVIHGTEYQALRISTFALEDEFSQYPLLSDAIGVTYQQDGHTFYVLQFPTANKTWVWDKTNAQWHQRAWTDNQGTLNRHRMNCICNAYNQNIVGDWQNGNLYAFDTSTYVDNVDGAGLNPDGSYPITRIRSWPGVIDESKRITYNNFIADMQVGDYAQNDTPQVSLSWSDDRGRTYNNPIEQSLGKTGQYLTNMQWRRLGQARGRVFQLEWSVNGNTALNGAWVDIVESLT